MKEATIEVVRKYSEKIKARFSGLLLKVGKVLEGNIDIEDFRFFIKDKFRENKAFKNAVNRLANARVLDVFEVITDHGLWDYWNYYTVETIVDEFAEDNMTIKEFIDKYLSELAGFKFGTKLSSYIEERAHTLEIKERAFRDQSPLARYDRGYYNKLELVLKVRADAKCLAYVDEVWKSIATHCVLPSLPALLDMIQKGCLKITWMVPIPSALQLQVSIPGSEKFFQEQNIARITLEDAILYDDKLNEVRIHR